MTLIIAGIIATAIILYLLKYDELTVLNLPKGGHMKKSGKRTIYTKRTATKKSN